jgi:hypothetical protein
MFYWSPTYLCEENSGGNRAGRAERLPTVQVIKCHYIQITTDTGRVKRAIMTVLVMVRMKYTVKCSLGPADWKGGRYGWFPF